MKIDSVPGFPGALVSIPIELTNDRPIIGLNIRLHYDVLAESLHSVTPGERVADWEFFDATPDTGSGEIHIVGYADFFSPVDTIVMPAGSGVVGYLNFKVYDPSLFVGSFTDVVFLYPESDTNVMRDSTGGLIGHNEITYLNGGIDLRTTDVSDWRENRPNQFALEQNFPNPFNPQTKIDFYLPASEHARLVVYDLLGRTVRQLVDENLPAGAHAALWDGRDSGGHPAASGVYFYRLVAGPFHQTKKMILVK